MHVFDLTCDRLYHLWILSKAAMPPFDIRAGDIDLQHIYRLVCKTIYHFNIFLCGMSAYIDTIIFVSYCFKRDVSLDKQINARVLKSDRI